MKNNDNFYIRKMKENIALRDRLLQFLKDWEQGDIDNMKDYILEDAFIDFNIFDRGISREELLERLKEQPEKKVVWRRYDPNNYVGLFENGKAQLSCYIVMEIAGGEEGELSEFNGIANFIATLERVDEYNWQFREMRLQLKGDDLIMHPVLKTTGIPYIKGSGDRSLVSNWNMHDDRIGWFENKKLFPILAELDMPWNVIKNPDYIGSDEEQIERTIFTYYYGVDQTTMGLYNDVTFNDDAMIIYADGTPLNLREEMEAMRTQIQGSPRVTHVAKVYDIQVDGNHAVARSYNRIPGTPDYADPVKRNERRAWARYRFTLTKRNGMWRIDRLNYYPALFVAEPAE